MLVLLCAHPAGPLLARCVFAPLAWLAPVVLGRLSGPMLTSLLSGIVVVVVSHWVRRSRVRRRCAGDTIVNEARQRSLGHPSIRKLARQLQDGSCNEPEMYVPVPVAWLPFSIADRETASRGRSGRHPSRTAQT